MVAQELSNGAFPLQRCECGRSAKCSYEGVAVCRSCWEDLVSLSAGDAMYSRPMVFARKVAWTCLLGCACIGVLSIVVDAFRHL
jgi:hypothetical protein